MGEPAPDPDSTFATPHTAQRAPLPRKPQLVQTHGWPAQVHKQREPRFATKAQRVPCPTSDTGITNNKALFSVYR